MWTSVVGPLRGHFIATYACPVGELGDRFVGYFKLYTRRPDCFCDNGFLHSGVTPLDYPSQEAAVHQALLAAREPLGRLLERMLAPYELAALAHEAPRASCCALEAS